MHRDRGARHREVVKLGPRMHTGQRHECDTQHRSGEHRALDGKRAREQYWLIVAWRNGGQGYIEGMLVLECWSNNAGQAMRTTPRSLHNAFQPSR